MFVFVAMEEEELITLLKPGMELLWKSHVGLNVTLSNKVLTIFNHSLKIVIDANNFKPSISIIIHNDDCYLYEVLIAV